MSKTNNFSANKFQQPFEKKKRDKILPPGVLLQLMKKSDWEGCKRLFSNLGFMALNAYAIHKLDIYPSFRDAGNIHDLLDVILSTKMLAFVPLYIFYGFQMQCMGFAGGHELLHGSGFKTRWMNTLATFFVSTAFFEVLWHERINHKQHHMYTLDIDRDPELTSFYSRKELESMQFKSAPDSKYSYFKAFVHVTSYFRHRMCRLISSSLGIPTDYTGLGWSMKSPQPQEIERSVVRELQVWSILQLAVYVAIFANFGTTLDGIKDLLFWWMVPCIVGYGPINYVRNAEHTDCDLTNDCMLNTRTVESNRFARWLLWETNFHAEHHAYPAVPFYNLPKLHEYLNDHIKHNECKTFTSQNWHMVRKGGWIDKQNSFAKAA
jgi:fatty acid desaturase